MFLIYFQKEKNKWKILSIEHKKGFSNLLKKEKRIKSKFHGNRDFYNIIKGEVIEG